MPQSTSGSYNTTVNNLHNNVSVNITNNSGCGNMSSAYLDATESITASAPVPFTPPPATKLIPKTTSPTTTKTTPTTVTTLTPASSAVTPATTDSQIKLTSISVGGQVLASDKAIEFKQSQTLNLIGHTTANGLVTLTIHSTPTTVATTADGNGDWSYTVSGLAAGNHYIEASVTDPITKQVSAATKLVSFTIDSKPLTLLKPSSTKPKLIVGSIIIFFILAGALAFAFMKKKVSLPFNKSRINVLAKSSSATSESFQPSKIDNQETKVK